MNQDELRETLRQLHAELAQADQIDTQSLELLNQLTVDVDRIVLGKKMDSVGDQPIPTQGSELSYSDQLRSMVSTFETRHPVISGLLERLSDGLANLGI
ncbi:MAG: DUF4404 family protein [Fuerstiella sp.]